MNQYQVAYSDKEATLGPENVVLFALNDATKAKSPSIYKSLLLKSKNSGIFLLESRPPASSYK